MIQSYDTHSTASTPRRRLWQLLIMACWAVVPCCVYAQDDSLRVISEVTVRGRMRYHETVAPQKLDAQALSQFSAHSVADALRWMSGVQLKDYGGIGGLKTVNLRSLGSQHVGIYYDGIELSNAQNGVIDLGQFSLDNVEEVNLYNGQRSAILQTASDFAQAGSIYIRTLRPTCSSPIQRAKLQYGASQTLRASWLLARNIYKDIAINLNVEGLSSSGHYPFTYRRRNLDGSIAYDTTAVRQNGDILSLRAEANLYGHLHGGHWQAKAYTLHADRGIPGAIVNNVWRRGERQTDHNTLLQATLQRDFGQRYTLRAQAKYAYYDTHFVNRDTTTLRIDQRYHQHEAYANVTQALELTPWWSVSLSYDVRWNRLTADIPLFADPVRWTQWLSLATAFDLHRIQMHASCVAVRADDKVRHGQRHTQPPCLSPAFFVSYQALPALQLRGFVKQSFRMPTFNDLYYTEVGNALLRPETATQACLGFRLESRKDRALSGTLDVEAYHNHVRNKIVAYPKGQQFRWTMLNLGRVQIDGLEIRGEGHWVRPSGLLLTAMAQYTYQRARDVTSPADSYYGHQIPYTPWHSGSLSLLAQRNHASIGYNFVYTGERYSQPENIPYNHVQPWYTSDFTLAYQWRKWRYCLEIRNAFDQQYDVILNYPMPGRNLNFSMQCEL